MGPNSTIENGTDDHDQASLVSALTGDEADQSLMETSTEDDAAETTSLALATTTTGASTHISNISNASSTASTYFMPGHRPSDSLCYSTTSSTNSNSPSNAIGHSLYLGPLALGTQQAFPSSMFPGQKLISPSSDETQKQNGGGSERTLPSPSSRGHPSYFYYSASPRSTGSSSSSGNRYNRLMPMPSSYQHSSSRSNNNNPHSNVYQNRRKGCFTGTSCDDDDNGSRSSWNGAMRCFFSPRVLVTLVVCTVLILNLLRLGEHHYHQQKQSSSSKLRKGQHGINTMDARTDDGTTTADYIKFETIGGGSASNLSF